MNRRRYIAALLAAVLSAVPAAGQIVPTLGPRLVINQTTAGAQTSPGVAFSPAGTFLAVWTGPVSGQHIQVFGRLLDVAGNPTSGEFQISSSGATPSDPRVAGSAVGFAVAWIDQGVFLRRYDSHGSPLSDAVRIDPPEPVFSCDVALNAAGDALVVWTVSDPQTLQSHVNARRVSSNGTLGDLKPLTPDSLDNPTLVRVAAAPDGGFVTQWIHYAGSSPPLRAQRLDPAGNWTPPIQVLGASPLSIGSRPLFQPDGSFTILWTYIPFIIPEPITSIAGRRFDAAGNPLNLISLDSPPTTQVFDAVSDLGGNILVFSLDSGSGAEGRLVDRWGERLTNVTFLPQGPAFQTQPAVAVNSAGDFLALWTLGTEPIPTYGDGSSSAILGQRLDGVLCLPGSAILCLGPNSRFQARVDWTNPGNGATGVGHSLPLTVDTGAFWFFGDQNLELMVKVLDGTSLNGHFWLYGGSLSNVEYTLTVLDALTGIERTYHNPSGQFASLADVGAFPSGTPPNDKRGGTAASLNLQAAVGCTGDTENLCLSADQFVVRVDFTDPRTGLAEAATAVPLTADTGAFWFFDDSNLELMVKVLDGTSINGKFWVFYGALSDVDYTITVTRTATGEVRTYHNPRGTLASHADTQAF